MLSSLYNVLSNIYMREIYLFIPVSGLLALFTPGRKKSKAIDVEKS